MKRTLAFILVFSFVLVLAGCQPPKDTKEEIFALVEENYDAIIAACESKDEQALLSIDGITTVKITDGYVLVFCKGAGIAPSSQDYGFYYSTEKLPVAVDCDLNILCDSDGLTPEGNGYQYQEKGNTFYTEHIAGNLYFYSCVY